MARTSRRDGDTATAQRWGYELAIEGAHPNGVPHKVKLLLRDREGKTVTTDRADLESGEGRRTAARTVSRATGVPVEKVLPKIEKAYREWLNSGPDLHEPPRPPSLPPGSPYFVEEGRICRRKFTSGGAEAAESLCNFTARIAEEIVRDDGSGEERLFFAVEGQLAGGRQLPRVEVSSGDFVAMNWPLRDWGLHAVVSAGQASRDHLRVAIQEMSSGAPKRVVYQHTGWRQEQGTWFYLHAGGAIGPEGLALGGAVALDGPLSRFELPEPRGGADLVEAVRASLAFLGVGPPRLTYPLLAAVYRAVLGPADFGLNLVGHTGHGKSELISLSQQHFGPSMDRLNLPGSWLSTGNALEGLAFQAKDALLAIDDFKPGGGRAEIDRMHQLAERVFRGQGNNSGRLRCRPDGSLRPARPPRGLIVSSGEDVPRGESLRARLLVLYVGRGDIVLSDLTPHQAAAARGLYALALAGFLRWLAPRYESVRSGMRREHAELRARALELGGHARVPGIVADLFLGLGHLLDFATELGAVSRPERERLAGEGWGTLLEAAREQAAGIAEQDPGHRFLRLLLSAISSGRAHVADREGESPTSADAWGWRLEREASASREERWVPLGRRIAWMDAEGVYLDPESAYAEAQSLAEAQGEPLAVGKPQLQRRLKEQGFLASFEEAKTTNRRTLQGKYRPVLHLRPGALTSEKQGGQGEQGESPVNTEENRDVSSPGFPEYPEEPGDETGGNPCKRKKRASWAQEDPESINPFA